ncbi:MAG: hypothetical protein ACHQ9S_04735 [Candidatus Binatia bacterium]
MKPEGTEPIKIVGVIVDEVGHPRMDRSPGSALYAVPFQLSRRPSTLWERRFLETWDSPPRFTSMHRPGIARVSGDKIVLDGTTIEEVERYHLETLKLAIAEANRLEQQDEVKLRQRASAEEQKREQHRQHVVEAAKRLKFED